VVAPLQEKWNTLGAMAEAEARWIEFFERIKKRPPDFYAKCIGVLKAQDIFEPDDLKDTDPALFDSLELTAGQKTFLKQALDFAKAGAIPTSSTVSAPPVSTMSSLPTNSTLPRDSTISLPRSSTISMTPLMAVDFEEPPGGHRFPVATLILPGNEDCAALMRRGGVEVKWRDRSIKKFIETNMPKLKDDSIILPTLYLQFLDKEFHVKDNEYNLNLRSGNDNSELQIVLPSTMISNLPDDIYDGNFAIVKNFLVAQAEVMSSSLEQKADGFAARSNYTGTIDPTRYYFSLRTARPKADINLDKAKFGIPAEAQLYLFAENHASVSFMSDDQRSAFEECINEMLSSDDATIKKFGVFLKVFYEGGFGYNHKIAMGGGYLPKNVAIACMTVQELQKGGITTGNPYLLPSGFLPFKDTVPATIQSIATMSERHKRYGFCFTRCIFVWETEALASKGALNFCSILPHGGFYYVPESLQKHRTLGGLLYSFGEAKEERGNIESGIIS